MAKCLEKICGIYKIENKINGKVYIGQSVNINKRFYIHRFNAYNEKDKKLYNLYLYVAIRKYGKNNFTYTIIEQCDKSLLNEREQYWIQYYRSNQKEYGYNLSDGGNTIYVNHLKNDSNITLKKQRVSEIKGLLLNSKLSIQEIAKQFNITTNSVTNINRGHSWFQEDIDYPIRNTREKTIYYCPQCGKQLSTKYSKLCKRCDGKRQSIMKGIAFTKEMLEEDLDNYGLRELSKKYNVSETTICRWAKKYNLKLKGWRQKRRLKYE